MNSKGKGSLSIWYLRNSLSWLKMANRRTSIKLIEKAVTEKWIRQLAFYHLMKYNFNNSCIYNYKSRMNEVAGKLDISTKTQYNNLSFLKSKELIGEHKNNLMLKSIRDFKARKKTLLLINGNHSLYDITCLLYAKLIEQSANHQAYAESIRLNEKRFTKDKKAQNGRGDGFNRGLSENPFRSSFFFRTIAKIINCSEYKAFQVVIVFTSIY
jgi:hypothetical protein